MRGIAIDTPTLTILILSVVTVIVMATFLSRNLIKSTEWTTITYEDIAAHMISTQQKLSVIENVDKENLHDFAGGNLVNVVLYDVESGEVLYSDLNKEQAIEYAKYFLEKIPATTFRKVPVKRTEGELSRNFLIEAYAMPVIYRGHVCLLILVADTESISNSLKDAGNATGFIVNEMSEKLGEVS